MFIICFQKIKLYLLVLYDISLTISIDNIGYWLKCL
jgi:hypothetical protein